jgi:hypothetical protein
MTQLQPACGRWIKKGLMRLWSKKKQRKNEESFMINSLLYCDSKPSLELVQVRTEQYK